MLGTALGTVDQHVTGLQIRSRDDDLELAVLAGSQLATNDADRGRVRHRLLHPDIRRLVRGAVGLIGRVISEVLRVHVRVVNLLAFSNHVRHRVLVRGGAGDLRPIHRRRPAITLVREDVDHVGVLLRDRVIRQQRHGPRPGACTGRALLARGVTHDRVLLVGGLEDARDAGGCDGDHSIVVRTVACEGDRGIVPVALTFLGRLVDLRLVGEGVLPVGGKALQRPGEDSAPLIVLRCLRLELAAVCHTVNTEFRSSRHI